MAQTFEGKIVYKNTYKSKIANATAEQFKAMLGDVQNYYVKGGSYKSETNGQQVLWQLYTNGDDKLYTKFASSEAILWNDVTVNPDELISKEVHKGAAVILGYTCDELVLNLKSGTQKYYYTSKLPVDPNLFAKHLFGNWYTVLSTTKALPLKMIIENTQAIVESTATEVRPMKLEATIFSLPAGVRTAKSPY